MRFASDIRTKDRLDEVLRMAADEARRSGGPRRTYRQVLELSDEERLRDVEDFTVNIVELWVYGPEQPNISVTDLPGIVGGRSITEDLVKQYISKPETVILLCHPAGGSDASSASPEVRLAMEADPESTRTIGIITKPDHLDDSHMDVASDLIVGESLEGWTAKHGWWPLYLKVDHADNAMVTRFKRSNWYSARRGWSDLEERAGRKLTGETAQRHIYQVFENAVRNNLDRLQSLLAERLTSIQAEQTRLPPAISEPVEALHSKIDDLAARLYDAILHQPPHATALIEHEKTLRGQLEKGLPQPLPYLEEHEGIFETYEPLSLDDRPELIGGEVMYLDRVLEVILKRTSHRTGSFDGDNAREELIADGAKGWHDICRTYIEVLWKKVEHAVEQLVDEQCGRNIRLARDVKRILKTLQSGYKSLSLDLAATLCEQEQLDPLLIDARGGNSDQLRQQAAAHYLREYLKLYPGLGSQHAPHNDRPRGPQCDLETLTRCFAVMASIAVLLPHGAERIAVVVGRTAQAHLTRYLKAAGPTLRKELGLGEVGPNVRKRAQGWCEPDQEVVKKRKILERQRNEIERISRHLKEAQSEE